MITRRRRKEGRSDDNPEAIAERLAIYTKETEPLTEYYAKKGLLKKVDARGDIQAVSKGIQEAIRN